MRKIFLALLVLANVTGYGQIVGFTGPNTYVRKLTVLTQIDSLTGIDIYTGRNLGTIHRHRVYGNGFIGQFKYGQNAQFYANGTEWGNISIGRQALRDNSVGEYNVAIGYDGLLQIIGGNNNTAIGPIRAGWSQVSGDRNLMIGYYADVYNLTGSDQMNIAGVFFGNNVNNTTSAAPSTGNLGVFVNNPLKNIHMNGTYRHTGLGAAVGDTTTYKPFAINPSNGDIVPFNRWPVPATGTIDAVPTNGSTNAVQSDGVFDALALKAPLTMFASGTYTPTVTGLSNVDAVNTSIAHYIRIGDKVAVYLYFSIDATTSATNTGISITLPVASNFTLGNDSYGSFNGDGFAGILQHRTGGSNSRRQ